MRVSVQERVTPHVLVYVSAEYAVRIVAGYGEPQALLQNEVVIHSATK